MGNAMEEHVLERVRSVVFKKSKNLEGYCTKIEGYDFDHGVNYSELLKRMVTTGCQASNLGDAIEVVNQMRDWRLSNEPIVEDCNEEQKDVAFRENVKCKIFLGFTSNLISSGLRETIRYLVQHHMVHVVVTTAGGVEEDLIKCFGPTYRGDFSLPGKLLRKKGLNRIGNMLVPNENYCKFQDWIMPIFNQMLEEQKTNNMLWTPSRMIARLGKELNDESSYLHWAYKNNVPVFCPGLTDGSLGDMLYFHSYKNPGLVVDVVQDIRAVNGEAVHASPSKTGVIILGGGLPKLHICNANMMRNGADFAVFINTAQEFDGSDSGASPDEAVSWGKLRESAKSVKVHCDATIAFPLLVAQTFAQRGEKEAPIALAKPKKSGSKKHRKARKDPPYLEMITDAMATLKEKNGSSQKVIQKFIKQKHKNLNCFGKPFLWHLKRLSSAGKLVKVKDSYKLPAAKPKPKATSEMKLKNKAKSVVTPKANVASKPKAKPAVKRNADKVAVKLKANAKAAVEIARTSPGTKTHVAKPKAAVKRKKVRKEEK